MDSSIDQAPAKKKFFYLVLIMMFLYLFSLVLTSVVFLAFNLKMEQSPILLHSMLALTTIVSFALPMVLFNRKYASGQPCLKIFHQTPEIHHIMFGVLLIIAANLLSGVLSSPDSSADIMRLLPNRSPLWFCFLLFGSALLPALCEEWFFRGGLQKTLIQMFGNPWLGIILASALFSLAHADLSNFFARFVLGFALGVGYFFSKSIWTSIIMHFLNNASVLTLLFFFEGSPLTAQSTSTPVDYILAGIGLIFIILYCVNFSVAKKRSKN